MIGHSRLIAVVPARKGSKGIPKKNLYELDGISLVERAIRLALKIQEIDQILVSSDDSEVLALVDELKLARPIQRPGHLATAEARTIDVIRGLAADGHLLHNDCVLLLQPTTPLRRLSDLREATSILQDKWETTDAVVSVVEAQAMHPNKSLIIKGDSILPFMNETDSSVPRQSLPEVYMPNGGIYLGKVDVLLAENTFVPSRSAPLIMEPYASVNLDTALDILLLEAIVAKGFAKQALIDSGR